MDIAKIRAEIEADGLNAGLAGVDVSTIRFNIYDLTDFDALNELEQFIKTGRKIYYINTIDIPHIVIASSPGKKV